MCLSQDFDGVILSQVGAAPEFTQWEGQAPRKGAATRISDKLTKAMSCLKGVQFCPF